MREINESKLLELERRISVLEGWKEGQRALLESIRKDVDELKSRITSLDKKVDRIREEINKK